MGSIFLLIMNDRITHFTKKGHALFLSVVLAFTSAYAEKPNVVIIFCDDLGSGDVSSYNKESKIKTPNIDSLAADGVRFTDGHSNSAVCTPSRYGMLTGQYAWRTRLKRGVLNGYSKPLIAKDRATIASMLKTHGYKTACIGKWHLGMTIPYFEKKRDYKAKIKDGPTTRGFDYFLGISASLDMPPYAIIENDTFTEQPTEKQKKITRQLDYTRAGDLAPGFKHVDYLPDVAEKASAWITKQAKGEKPFFLYLPLPSPHKPVIPNESFKGKSGIGQYGDYVLETDWAVGQVIKSLKGAGVYENTLIIFTSDNASFAIPETYNVIQTGHKSNMHYKGQKTDIYEGGHRVPYIISWPKGYGHNKSKTSKQLICITDAFATIQSAVAGKDASHEDGFSFHEYLKGDLKTTASIKPATIHHSGSGVFAIRSGDWKLILSNGAGGRTKGKTETKGQLYNMAMDESEKNNLYASKPEVVKRLTQLLNQIKASSLTNIKSK